MQGEKYNNINNNNNNNSCFIYLLIIFCEGRERKKGKPNLFLSLRKGHGPTCIIFFSSLVCTFYHLCLCHITYTLSLSLPHTRTHHLHYSSFLFISHLHLSIFYLPIPFYLHFSTHHTTPVLPEQKPEERREKHTQKVRERKALLFSSKSSAASTSRTLSLLLSFAYK